MAILNLSAPWIIMYQEINAMFKHDPQVHVVYDDEEKRVNLYVESDTKAAALERLLASEHNYGNVILKVCVVPANGGAELNACIEYDELFDLAFEGNAAYSFSRALPPDVFISNPMTFVVFRKEVVQFWTDDLGDYNGNCSTLYQDIALAIFDSLPGVYYSTDTEDPVVGFGRVVDKQWP